MSAKETEYNGWANYETWAVNLWLTNERGTVDYWREQASCEWERAGVNPENWPHWTRSVAARYNLADSLKDELTDSKDEMLEGAKATCTLWADLLGAAMSEVDWQEIAGAFLDDLDGYESAA